MEPKTNHIDRVYAIRDDLVGVFLPPFICDSDARAIRDFGDVVANNNTPVSKHPADYTLHFIGFMNRETGLLASAEDARIVARASDFVLKEAK